MLMDFKNLKNYRYVGLKFEKDCEEVDQHKITYVYYEAKKNN